MGLFAIRLAQGALAQVFLVAAILAAIVTLLLRLYRYQARQKRLERSPRARAEAEPENRAYRADAPADVIRWEVQMQELARDLKAQIDSKMVALGNLIRDADRAAARLEAALPRTGFPAAESPASGAARPLGQTGSEDEEELRREVFMLADYGFPPEDIAGRLGLTLEQVDLILRRREPG